MNSRFVLVIAIVAVSLLGVSLGVEDDAGAPFFYVAGMCFLALLLIIGVDYLQQKN